jgi:hypothetical protein
MTVDPKTLRANWNYPTTIRIGPGRIAELAAACREIGMARPLLVTDPGLAALPMVKEAIAANAKAGVPTGLYTDLKPNPVSKNVADGVAAFRAGRHDGIVAFGGGSALDTGKSIAFMAGQTRPIWDFEDIGDWWTRADASGIAPVIAVPTTAGTGSEVGRATAIINEKTHEKKIIFHPRTIRGSCSPTPNSWSACRPSSRPAPAWTPWRIASRPIARRASTPWPRAWRWRACGSPIAGWRARSRTGATSPPAPT